MLRRASIVIGCVLSFGLGSSVLARQQPAPLPSAGRFAHAAVAADHAIASQAGVEILQRGGNAVDAAVATSFALSVVRPFSCGIGGGGFMVIHLASHPNPALKLPLDTTLNYREQAPAWATPDCFERLDANALAAGAAPDSSTKGGTAVAVPGTILGLLTALERYGTLDRAAVLAPAIRVAEQGFVVDEAYLSAVTEDVLPWFAKDPVRRERFAWVWRRFLRDGNVRIGDVITLPEQAQALRLLARDGVVAFTQGPIGLAIVAAVRGDIGANPAVAGGGMTAADLAAQTVVELPPLVANFRGDQVLTMPPPSSGGIVLAQVFATLDARNADILGVAHNSPDYIHFVAEASKHAFADRARWLADPAFTAVPLAALLNPDMLRTRARAIDVAKVGPLASYGLSQLPEDHGTSHLSVVDAWGNAVACTETINLVFGSLLAVPEFGFVLNNQMDDFLTRRGKPNAFGLTQSDRNLPAPGKRPLSSMSPTIVVHSEGGKPARVRLVIGASGGPRIISATLQSALNVLAFNQNALEAVSSPRFHHQWMPNELELEARLRRDGLVGELTGKGHQIKDRAVIGVVQLIRWVEGTQAGWDAASDPRKGGVPAGY